jgi:hypothetical protein
LSIEEQTLASVLRNIVIVMKLPVTLQNILSILILITNSNASSVAPLSVLLSKTTIQEKKGGHGCAANGCNETQSIGSALIPRYPEVVYGAIVISFAALA